MTWAANQLVRRRDLGLALQDDGAVLVRAQSAGIAARVPAAAVGVLAFFSRPRTLGEAREALGPVMERLVAGLHDAGLLVEPGEAERTPRFFDNFSALDVHRRMLADTARLEAYRAAIAQVVPGRVVLDAGTGTGVLAVLAARAGATRVHAVDNSDMLERARIVVADSGLADVITCHRGDFADLELPEPVDCIVTETFGALALAEGAGPDLQRCAERCLARDGIVVPAAVSLHLAPITDPSVLEPLFEPWDLDGIDLGSLARAQARRGVTHAVPSAGLGHPGEVLARLPFPRGAGSASGSVRFDGLNRGVVGLCGWFTLHLTADVDLRTGPDDPPTHWHQVILPLDPGHGSSHVGETPSSLAVDMQLGPAPDDRRALEIVARWTAGQRSGTTTWRLR